jgi:hypothetical protein
MKAMNKFQELSRSQFLKKLGLALPILPVASIIAQTDEPTPKTESKPELGTLRAIMELARADIRTQKSFILAQNLPLTDSEAEAFWPLQREYDFEFTKLLDRRYAAIIQFAKQYGSMTDPQAITLAKASFDIESERTGLKKEYFEKFCKVVPALKAARFFQIENQLNLVLDLQVAASLPLLK